MHRQIERELNRARIRDIKIMPVIEIFTTIERIVSTLQRTPDSDNKDIQIACKKDLCVQMVKDDLAEILGNLLENALKHAVHNVSIKVAIKNQFVVFEIEDDSEGISSLLREAVQERGVRLDESIAGSGLGLAIVGDVLEAYNENLKLEKSPLGGLQASFQLPLSPN